MDDDQSSKLDDTSGQAQTQPQGTPVSTPVKEQEPSQTWQEPIPSPEMVIPSEAEPSMHPEVAEVGVEKVREVPTLTLEDQKAGLQLAKESVPVSTQPSGLVDLPKDEKEAASFLKVHRDVKNAVVWLVAMLLRQFRQAHEKVVGVKP